MSEVWRTYRSQKRKRSRQQKERGMRIHPRELEKSTEHLHGVSEGELRTDKVLYEGLWVKWCKSYACVNRWREEILLLQEEMRRCLVTLEWQAKSWEQQADIDTFEAYTFEQAAVRRKIVSRFASLWSGEMAILREFKPDNLDLEPLFKDLPRPPNRNADEVIENEDIEAKEDLAGEGEDEDPVLDEDEDEELDKDEEDQEDGLGSEPDEQMFGDEERSSSSRSSDGSGDEDEVENLTLKEILTALEEEGDF
ncbi:hypothetical protein K435DRAFT_806990 [Dendrothele bispora CBS 962.96]|uniref:Uncharacterized protein n=1 Tax=Dendrothele bispora (strain CBS 962.96) TaxID=1314807 RepID=A0A4S8L648_DENBC|nr:hypothetical protein K435DRAFT_806990 [Dendrothele bispora CBS 962.96]